MLIFMYLWIVEFNTTRFNDFASDTIGYDYHRPCILLYTIQCRQVRGRESLLNNYPFVLDVLNYIPTRSKKTNQRILYHFRYDSRANRIYRTRPLFLFFSPHG